jgi:hypothetical protein
VPATETPQEYHESSQPKPEAMSHDPLAGAEGDPNRVQSASLPSDGTPNESLLKMAKVERPVDPTTLPADQTQIVVHDGKEAAATPKGNEGAFGQALPPGGEVAGGNIAKVLDPPPGAGGSMNAALTRERAALLSPVGRKLAPYIQRPPAEWGIIGPGDQIRGHMLLLNLNSGEKHRAMDGHVVNDGELYLNLRNLPESLSTGNTIDQLLASG